MIAFLLGVLRLCAISLTVIIICLYAELRHRLANRRRPPRVTIVPYQLTLVERPRVRPDEAAWHFQQTTPREHVIEAMRQLAGMGR